MLTALGFDDAAVVASTCDFSPNPDRSDPGFDHRDRVALGYRITEGWDW